MSRQPREFVGENNSMAVDHYENFPVASVLCPPALREPIVAIYHFARTADDIADEGDDTPAQRLSTLAQYRADLAAALNGQPHSDRWPRVFGRLPGIVRQFTLPAPLLHDLISAFEQDVRYTAAGHYYANRGELLAYCKLSANPVGRLLLQLYGVQNEVSLQQSDCICSALQLVNFWQDLCVDIPRGRHYLPTDACAALGVARAGLLNLPVLSNTIKLIANEVHFSRELMQKGQALAKTLPGRAGWELRLVIQGGLRILDKIEALNFNTLHSRPMLRWWDLPVMLWRALWM